MFYYNFKSKYIGMTWKMQKKKREQKNKQTKMAGFSHLFHHRQTKDISCFVLLTFGWTTVEK